MFILFALVSWNARRAPANFRFS